MPHPYDHASWTEPDDEDWDEDGEDGGILAEVVAVARRVVTARIGRRRLGLEDDPEIDDARSDARGGFRRESGFGWTRFLPRGGVLDPLDPLQFALLGVIVVALFLAGYLVVVVPVRLIQNGAAYADAIGKISQAEQTEHTAMSENDPNTRRQLLDQAATLAAAAHNEQPQSATIAATEARIRDEYKAASGADSFGTPIRLVDLPAPGDRLIAKGVNLFVLDQTDSRLYRYLMNADGTTAQTGGNPVVVQRGDHLGLITVGQLTRMAWVPGANSGNAALVVLDSAGFLIRYATDSGLSLLALHDPTTWGDVSALAASTDTLYAARSTADTLTAYTAQPSGYDGTAQNALAGDNRPNLSDVSALAADGDLFVVRQNGALLRLAGGEVASDTPDTTKLFAGPPAGLAVAGSALFVGDPRGDRIVQLSRAGEFQRYLTAGDNSDVLGQVRDLAVSADGTALYALTNDAIYRLPLPIQSS